MFGKKGLSYKEQLKLMKDTPLEEELSLNTKRYLDTGSSVFKSNIHEIMEEATERGLSNIFRLTFMQETFKHLDQTTGCYEDAF